MHEKVVPGLGYLVWKKIPAQCLDDPSLELALRNGDTECEYGRLVETARTDVLHTIEALRARNIRHVRTGISWAEWYRPGGQAYAKWYIRAYKDAGFHILPTLTYTPPELGVESGTNAPPRDLRTYAHFVGEVCDTLQDCFDEVELWNEWNLNTDWDPQYDPEYRIFAVMIGLGASAARARGMSVVLGGMSKVNDRTLILLRTLLRTGVGGYLDAIGFHNLRGTWSDHIPPPPLDEQGNLIEEEWAAAERVRPDDVEFEQALSTLSERSAPRLERRRSPHGHYLTEYGFPPVPFGTRRSQQELEEIQVVLFAEMTRLLLSGRLSRGYWYTLRDKVSPSVRFTTTGWEDWLQYYYGDSHEDGSPKLLGSLLLEGGPTAVLSYVEKLGLWHLLDEASLKRDPPPEYHLTQQRV